MRKKIGLRAEIIVSLILLMGAALLFSGMLLLKLAEVELVRQQEVSLREQVRLAGRLAVASGHSLPDRVAQLEILLDELQTESWYLTDPTNKIIASSTVDDWQPEVDTLTRSRTLREIQVVSRVTSSWFYPSKKSNNHVVVTAPLTSNGIYLGTLQVRFSLTQIDEQLAGAWRIALLYVGLYGAVLLLFGLWLLNKNVIRPIQALMIVTERIAAGDLDQRLPSIDGPREIEGLALSFNAMTASLKESRQQTEAHIHSLQQANAEVLRTQAELIRSEKLASVGRLTAGMAHEIGNPLGAVVGYLGLLQSELSDERQQKIASCALSEAERIDRLVREMLDYAAPAKGALEYFDPVTAVHEALRILSYQGVFDDLIIDNQLPATLPKTHMLRHQLVQVFINLLINARDATGKGGTICLAGGSDGEDLWLSVTDNGEGMTADVMKQIFDPFFTTKPASKGRGLGLAVCQRIIIEAEGRIDVRSKPEHGSAFTVWLKRSGVHCDG